MGKLVMPLAHTVFLPRQAAPMAQIKTVSLVPRLLKIAEEGGKVICNGNIEVHVAYYPFLPGNSNSTMDKIILVPFRTECPGALPACSLNDCTSEIRDVTWQMVSSHAFEVKANFYLSCDAKQTYSNAQTIQSANIIDSINCGRSASRTAFGSIIDCGIYEPILEETKFQSGIPCLPIEEENEMETMLPPPGNVKTVKEEQITVTPPQECIEKKPVTIMPPNVPAEEEEEEEAVLPPPGCKEAVKEEQVTVMPSQKCVEKKPVTIMPPNVSAEEEEEEAETVLPPKGTYPICQENVKAETVEKPAPKAANTSQVMEVAPTEENMPESVEEAAEAQYEEETPTSGASAAAIVTYSTPCAKRETVGNQYCLKFYLVQSGEDLAAVAEKHEVSKEKLEDANQVSEEDICTGMILNIPE